MQDKDFDEIVDTWVDHETESAPEMRPTADMYRLVRAKQKRKPAFFVRSRWAVAGATIASLVAILYVVLQSSVLQGPPSGQEVAWVGQREEFVSGRGVVVEPVPPMEKGPRSGAISFGQLVFHFQKQNLRFVQGVDLQAPHEETITLTPADNYRLLLEPAEDWYVYVFQLTSSDDLLKLFPNETYSAVQNPLQQGQTYYLPPEPNWFYLDQDAALHPGEERLYIVASAQSIQALDESYAQYSQADDESDKQLILAGLIEVLDTVESIYPGKAGGWAFRFEHK